jgi:hypothetical protein
LAAIFMRLRGIILSREADATWVKELIARGRG